MTRLHRFGAWAGVLVVSFFASDAFGGYVASTAAADDRIAVGACCVPLKGCAILTQQDCVQKAGGSYRGDGTDCSACSGACCLPEEGCAVRSDRQCMQGGGNFFGFGSTCEQVPCVLGACCFAGGSCEMLIEPVCEKLHGTFMGVNVPCTPSPCCVGDLNGDGAVNTLDLTRFLGRFGRSFPAGTEPADFNADGVVNTLDLTRFLGRFGQVCG